MSWWKIGWSVLTIQMWMEQNYILTAQVFSQTSVISEEDFQISQFSIMVEQQQCSKSNKSEALKTCYQECYGHLFWHDDGAG